MTKQEAIGNAINYLENFALPSDFISDEEWHEVKEVIERLKEIKINE